MDLWLLSPEIALVALALAVIGADLFTERKEALAYLSLGGLVVPAALVVALAGRHETTFFNALIVDSFAVFFKLLLLAATALVILASVDYVRRLPAWQGEYYALVLTAALGMMLMASAGDLVTLYMALELSTLSLCALTCFAKTKPDSTEAALKFVLLAAFSSAVLLYGMALLYGLAGTTSLGGISQKLAGSLGQPAVLLAVTLLIAGLGFKISAVPFQMWVPDVYQGAPTPITAYLAVASKTAGFAAVLRVFVTALGAAQADWATIVAVLAALTMTAGNLMAIPQSNIKRMLAYSSIGQAGYIMVGLAVAAKAAAAGPGMPGVLYFLTAYLFTELGAFIAVIAFSNQTGSDEIEDYAGLAARAPLLALGLALCLLSLVGMPPTAGFVGKVYVFYTAFQEGLAWLVVLAVVNTAISMYYYMRPIKVMYLSPARDHWPVSTTRPVAVALSSAVAGVFVVAVIAGPLIEAAQRAAEGLLP